ncbi:18031_t:CDS:1, partial [Acaulospora morrowiae]
ANKTKELETCIKGLEKQIQQIESKRDVLADLAEGNATKPEETPMGIRDKGRRDSRERNYDAENCPRKDDILQGLSKVNEMQLRKDDGKLRRSPEDLCIVSNETHRDEELHPDLHKREKILDKCPSKYTSIGSVNKASGPICDEIPTTSIAEILREKDNEISKTDETLKLTDETPTVQEDTDTYLEETTEEYSDDDEAVATKNSKENDDIDKTASKPKETDRLVARNLKIKYHQEGTRNRPESMSPRDEAEGSHDERICPDPQREVVPVDDDAEKVGEAAPKDETKEGQELTYDEVLVAHDDEKRYVSNNIMDKPEKDERNVESQYGSLNLNKIPSDSINDRNTEERLTYNNTNQYVDGETMDKIKNKRDVDKSQYESLRKSLNLFNHHNMRRQRDAANYRDQGGGYDTIHKKPVNNETDLGDAKHVIRKISLLMNPRICKQWLWKRRRKEQEITYPGERPTTQRFNH